MKTKSLLVGLLLSAVAANASVTISGTSLFNTEINGYSTGVYVVSDSGSFTETLMEDLVAGISFTQGTAIGNYTVIGTAGINPAGSSSALTAGITFNLGGNIATGNEIGILAFETSTASRIGGDTYKLFTNDWLVAADGANLSLTGGGPFTGPSVYTWSIPETSAYPMLAGLIALGCVMLRRRA